MTARVETRAEDGAMHIAVSGEIDLANAAAVEDQIREALSHSPETVSVDLTDLTYMDSAGIRILFTLASRLSRCGSCKNYRGTRLAHPPIHRAIRIRITRFAPTPKPMTSCRHTDGVCALATVDRKLGTPQIMPWSGPWPAASRSHG
jgi:anti-anti-sigma factor